jgi:hypothetical protein
MQDISGRDLKYQIIYRSKKNSYGMPNTYLTVPIPVSTGREYFSNPFVRKSYAALCTAYSSKQYSIPAVLLKHLPEENKYTEIPTGVKSTYRGHPEKLLKHGELTFRKCVPNCPNAFDR